MPTTIGEEHDVSLIVIQGGEQRIGQQMVNFINWLDVFKNIKDPFYISDDQMMKYWREYNV
jgi:hypothetical protein